jgi:hypothetical protein
MERFALVAIIAAVILFLLTLELTRRRQLSERYSILWFATAIGIFAVGIIPGALNLIARTFGIAYAPSALLLVAFLFALGLILHLSIVVSRLTAQATRLAQSLAILRAEVRERDTADHEVPLSSPSRDPGSDT